ncbi:MAG: hypothetical protein ACR2MD_04265 [Aridibacter sp.]|nr:hypothetical protein [Acidobacteriota bacterium]
MKSEENQPTLFDPNVADTEKVLLYALGDFQTRGFELIGRKLPLDRLLGAFKRAFEHFGIDEISDEKIAETLEKLGAKIDKVPNYVAKHPFRVTVNTEIADKSLEIYKSIKENDK